MKNALPEYAELYTKIQAALEAKALEAGKEWRRPLLIGIDGAMGCGKSSTASWLAWQLGMPVVHLDFYTDLATRRLTTGAGEVARLIDHRLGLGKPVIVEGILLLEALDAIGRRPDFLVYVDGEPEGKYSERVREYCERIDPRAKADFVLARYNDSDELDRADPGA
jgi:uridine kinase